MNRLTQVFTLSLLMLASSVALAERDNDRSRHYGQQNGHHDQRYDRHDGDRRYDKHGNRHGNRHGNKHGYKHGNRHGDRYYDRHQSRRYAQHDRNQYRHRHNGSYCYVNHAQGYGNQYDRRGYSLPFPPLPRFFFGGRIDF